MGKKNRFRDLLRDMSPEEEEKMRQKALAARRALTLAYQLGYYVGDYIVDNYLVTLSIDGCTTRKVINCTPEEEAEERRLSNEHSAVYDEKKKSEAADKAWKAFRAFHEAMEEKYLPMKIECNLQLLNVPKEHEAEFKKGLGNALWNCDASHYHTNAEHIDIKEDDRGWFTTITLHRAKE